MLALNWLPVRCRLHLIPDPAAAGNILLHQAQYVLLCWLDVRPMQGSSTSCFNGG